MTFRIIDPRSVLKLEYPNDGNHTLVVAQADHHFSMYAFNEHGLKRYETKGDTEEALRKSVNLPIHNILLDRMDVHVTPRWYLVIHNTNPTKIAVDMNVMHPFAVKTRM